ncbi:SatD family protein [Arenibacter sp. GZD96]|uniref:SatD family protein n=1 Tax=Aurantibrevibacter litoralis TaxID=3106030 RepID=UPI002AFE1E98|nr:SatD family protein [Arenibacter sp. GZD-96]MEA1786892.1 SatD family protein [Arenibacter sp. GZD-96]
MIAIITGDIINSVRTTGSEWMPVLKKYLSVLGTSPEDWEIYRGDEFQLKTLSESALETAIIIKALIKSIKGLDVRMGIGMGTETFKAKTIGESNGSAYQLSGRVFETLKEQHLNLAFASGSKVYDDTLNLMLKLALDFMDNWTVVSSEIIALALQNPKASQHEIALQLHIRQSAVSQRQKRARLDLVLEVLHYYKQTIKSQVS